MAYRDIDYSLRVNGDLSVPSSSIKVGSNITLNSADGKVSATVLSGKLTGDGSSITNLSSAAMSDVLKLDGSRVMTGSLVVSRDNASVVLRSATNATEVGGIEILETGDRYADANANGFRLGYQGDGNYFYLASKYTTEKEHIRITRLGDMSISSNLSISGNITVSGTVDGVDISSFKSSFDSHTHDNRYYTETEIDTKLSGKSNTGHTHLWEDITDKPSEFAPASHTHDDRYYTETEMNTKLAAKSDTGHTHTFASITSRPTTLSGYGITDAATSGHTHTFSSITSKPTTLSGYGITDAAASTHNHDTVYSKLGHDHDTSYAALSHNHDTVYSKLSHNHDSYSQRGSRNESIRAVDKRAWTPKELSTGTKEVQFAFTKLGLDDTGIYADGIMMSTYSDSSGGGVNALLVSKNSNGGVYHSYGAWSAETWS